MEFTEAGLCWTRQPGKLLLQAVFTHMELGECSWPAHDGQPPDET